jgi:hypothetical protein
MEGEAAIFQSWLSLYFHMDCAKYDDEWSISLLLGPTPSVEVPNV